MTPKLGEPGKAAELLAQILAMPHVDKFEFSIVPDGSLVYYQWLAEVRGERYGDRLLAGHKIEGRFLPSGVVTVVTPAHNAVILLRIAVRTLEELA